MLRRRPLAGAILDPYLAAGYGVPKLALAPLFILWFGIDLEPKIALVASIVFFLVFFSTMSGVNAVNAQYVSVMRVCGAKERDIARHVVWPGAIPYAFAGFRIAAPYAIGAAVVGELISSNRGLGFMINSGATDFDTTLVFVALVTLTARRGDQSSGGARRTLAVALASAAAGPHLAGDQRMTGVPILEVKGLAKRFRRAPAKRNRRSFWPICRFTSPIRSSSPSVGPSGAGKSTLLNIIAQVDGASEGEIFFGGELIETTDAGTLNPGWNCQIGYVTQDDNLLPWRTLIDNVTLPLKVQGRYRRRREGARRRAAARHRTDRLRAILSARIVGRHAEARVADSHARLRPADHPHGRAVRRGRRADARAAPAGLLAALEPGRKTIVFVTHDISEAIALGDRVLVLSRSPAKVIAQHRVDIARPRDLGNLYKLDGFGDMFEAVRRQIQ